METECHAVWCDAIVPTKQKESQLAEKSSFLGVMFYKFLCQNNCFLPIEEICTTFILYLCYYALDQLPTTAMHGVNQWLYAT